MDRKTLLILSREFMQTIRRKSFILMTLAFPVLALLGLGGYQLISGMSRPPAGVETISVGYVDKTGTFDQYKEQRGVSFIDYATEPEAKQALLEGKITQYLVVPSDYMEKGVIPRFTLKQEVTPPAQQATALRNFLMDNLLADQNSATRLRAKEPMAVVSTRLTEAGDIASNQGGFGAFIVPYLFAILLIISIFSSSGFLLQGLGEEKQNRVMEILLSSVSPRQLLTGKVLGLGAAGLVQIVIWLGTIAVAGPIASDAIGQFLGPIQFSASVFGLGLLYFILGYLLFAMIMAAVGAISPTAQEGQQLSTIFTLMAVVPLWFATLIIENPSHALTKVLTFIPLTAPITVMTRLGLTQVPWWEIAVSVALLVASILGTLFIASKVLRAFLLMYGKRPDMRQVIAVIRQV